MPLTNDKTITEASYWDQIISGKRMNAAVDSSNSKKLTGFDRFTIVVDIVEGPQVLEVAAGHARIASMLKARYSDWDIHACDQSKEGQRVSNFTPYTIQSVYNLSFSDKSFDTIIATQCVEYFEFVNKAFDEFKRVAKKGVFTFSNGEMATWSQLYAFTPESVKELLQPYGTIEVFEAFEHIILVKIKFNE